MELRIERIDPVLSNFDLPLRAVYHPLGFSLEIDTNCSEVLAAAEESWGHFRKVFSQPPVRLRIGVLEGKAAECPQPPVCREQGNLMVQVADAGNFYVCALGQRFGFAWLTQATVAHRAYLRWHFIEGMTWNLLNSSYVTSIHAACVERGKRGILLCGDSGAGKSSLAYACARRGWTLLSDDSCCLARGQKGRRVVGNPYQIRLRESATGLFPELKQQRRTPHNGELAIEVVTASMPEISTVHESSIHGVVFLNRGVPGPPRLLPFPKATAQKWFEQVICYGSEELRDAHKASLRNLLTAEILELQYNDLDSAVKLLEAMVRDESGAVATSSTDPARREHA
jgi:hypothetical protein